MNDIGTNQQKSPTLAAVLSFLLGGLGQIYNGQVGKGLLIFFTSWLIIPWIYGIINAYRTANKINEGTIVVPKRPGCVIAAIIFMVMMPVFLAILGILAAIAIPSFVKARGTVQAKICINNLRYIEQIKHMYALDNNLTDGTLIPQEDNNGIDDGDNIPDVLEKYFETAQKCPMGGKYNMQPVGQNPTCNIGGDHVLKE